MMFFNYGLCLIVILVPFSQSTPVADPLDTINIHFNLEKPNIMGNSCSEPFGVTGMCTASLPLWSYDKAAKQCKVFIYGGCSGNTNRFNTFQQCNNNCIPGDPCSEPFGVIGMCRAGIPMWSFDEATNQCQQFKYGGCGGNRNRFESLQQCYNKCNTVDPNFCVQAEDCKANKGDVLDGVWVCNNSKCEAKPMCMIGCNNGTVTNNEEQEVILEDQNMARAERGRMNKKRKKGKKGKKGKKEKKGNNGIKSVWGVGTSDYEEKRIVGETDYEVNDQHEGKICEDKRTECPHWKSHGYCTRSATWMNKNCAKSCNKCTGNIQNKECGMENGHHIQKTDYISGGANTKPYQYPWMVSFTYFKYKTSIAAHYCSGSLISSRLVLTAKHCAQPNGKPVDRWGKAKINVHNVEDPEDFNEVQIEKTIFHDTGDVNDIAILVLKEPVDLENPNIGLVCLPETDKKEYFGKQAKTMGWGMVSYNGKYGVWGDYLKHVDLLVTKKQDKMLIFTETKKINGIYQDPCAGDSGGPLLYKDNGRWVVIGTVNGGGYDCRTGILSKQFDGMGVWNKVTSHLDWIKTQINKYN